MATQDAAGIPLTHAADGVGYKLLELPSELLALLESENPPVLTLESSTTSAVLKHGSQTWSLRQKNTSNALMLLSPCETAASSSDIPQAGLKIISTVHDMVELTTEGASGAAPVARGKWHEMFARGR
ncbi:uncharacterized protein BCR38DRAFT_77744 [Pseudomassariella vexata]|uniref:Sister chromatid cohesion protein DCC1 n=1 Tax=Pseudomassariella vexata TaxID=1141098 RepID=A0A1Y2DGG9_9PEZI|nr:uncharacterized protein BCR38DRAFT_77744 [Pseudomassariella vexata]ORY58174.1 hypothetical protein BCR38DRAFT_77744 [Pseudomassariella vexata]